MCHNQVAFTLGTQRWVNIWKTIFYSKHKWSITFKTCESLHGISVICNTVHQLYINKEKIHPWVKKKECPLLSRTSISITKNITEAQVFSALENWNVLIPELTSSNMIFSLITFLSILKFLIIQTCLWRFSLKFCIKKWIEGRSTQMNLF